MSLFSLVYVSACSPSISDEELVAILETARTTNPQLGLTGMLLHKKGYFIQALEGHKETVLALYEKIKKDPRHWNVLTVAQDDVTERSFGDWSMGFKNLDHLDPHHLKGYHDFFHEPDSSHFITNNPSRAVHLLELFKDEVTY